MKNETQTRLFSAEIQGRANRLMASAVKLTMVSCDPSLAATSEMLLFRAWDLSSLATAKHPVHFVTDDGKLSPSAFIPFCEFGGDDSIMGRKIGAFKQTSTVETVFPVIN